MGLALWVAVLFQPISQSCTHHAPVVRLVCLCIVKHCCNCHQYIHIYSHLLSFPDRLLLTGFADDYALLISGLLDLYECGGGLNWLQWAVQLQETLDKLFWDKQGGEVTTRVLHVLGRTE